MRCFETLLIFSDIASMGVAFIRSYIINIMKLNYLLSPLSAIDVMNIKSIEPVSLFASLFVSLFALSLYNIVIYRSYTYRKIFTNYFHLHIYSSTSIRSKFDMHLMKLEFLFEKSLFFKKWNLNWSWILTWFLKSKFRLDVAICITIIWECWNVITWLDSRKVSRVKKDLPRA